MTPRDEETKTCPACAGSSFDARRFFLRGGLALLAKLALLAALYFLFFSPSHRF